MVGSGKCGRVGNGSGREREPRSISFPNATSRPLPDLGLCSNRLPSRLTASCSRPDCFPSRRKVYSQLLSSRRPPSCSHPIPTFAHNFSHPATHLSCGCFHPIYHGLNIFPSHFVLVPTVSHPVVTCIPGFSRPAVRPVGPIQSRRSHITSSTPQLT